VEFDLNRILDEEFESEYGEYRFTIYELENPTVELTTPDLDFEGG